MMSKPQTFRILVRTGQVHAIDIAAKNAAAALHRARKLWRSGHSERFDCIHHRINERFEIEADAVSHPIIVTNQHRARWAQAALDAYAAKDRCGIDTETLRDLITDLGHWADRNDVSFNKEVTHALVTWRREKTEEVQS